MPTDKPLSPLEQLMRGLLLERLKKEGEELAYHAIGRETFDQALVGKRQDYCAELQRVIDELRLTATLLEEIDTGKITPYKHHQPEELINYYTGIFLDQVHQAKDKMLKLIDHMGARDPLKHEYAEPKKVTVSGLRKKHGDMLDKAGINELLDEWSDNGTAIKTALDKRNEHHHRVSRLKLNRNYQNIQTSRLMRQPDTAKYLTDEGQKRMEAMEQDSLKKLKEDTVSKQRSTIEEIEKSTNAIADKLIAYYDVPTNPAEQAKIVNDYLDTLKSLEIKNEADASKVQREAQPFVRATHQLADQLGDHVKAVYLVGSVGRGEFIPGTSDLNVYVITDGYSRVFDSSLPITMYVIGENEFLSDAHKKDRFICWSDGILLRGKPYQFSSKEFPKPGAHLAFLLNRDAVQRLETLKNEIDGLEKPDGITLRLYSLKVAKIMMDLDYAVAMTNRPAYTASRKKKLEHIKLDSPDNYRAQVIEQIYYGGRVNYQDLRALADASVEAAKNAVAKLTELQN